MAQSQQQQQHHHNQQQRRARFHHHAAAVNLPTTPSSFDPRELARNASLNALTGGLSCGSSPLSALSASSPSARHLSASSSSNAPSMDSERSGSLVVDIGDTVEVPGGMTGVVKYVGGVKGKNGLFAGVELHRDFAARGKNDGDVEGTRYFTTSVPGAGIFLPAHRAIKQSSPTLSASTFPPTPTTPAFPTFDLNNKPPNGVHARTPPNNNTTTTPLPKFSQSVGPGSRPSFSQSVGPGARAPSPQLRKPRQSLPRPESPLRKQAPTLQPAPGKGFSASVRGGRPPMGLTPSKIGSGRPSNGAGVPRAASRSQSRQEERVSPPADITPPPPRHRPSVGSQSTSNGLSPVRATGDDPAVAAAAAAAKEEATHLKHDLEERDRQLKEQAMSLAEMESSLAELQSLVAQNAAAARSSPPRTNGEENGGGGDVSQLRAMLREKSEKIQLLTSEFDSHRADFRSTIDALEMASTETERVYEKRVQELLQELAELSERGDDVENVARQLKQLEEFVAELEEGLEDARRGEAEARSEVEFLRGEVERGRTELRREREKAAKALRGATGAMNEKRNSRELEQRDDEIRGLKAIIHSLSSGADQGIATPERKPARANAEEQKELSKLKEAVAELQREKGELQGMIERKSFREEELERELTRMKLEAPETPAAAARHGYQGSMASIRTAIRPTSPASPSEAAAAAAGAGKQAARSRPSSSSKHNNNKASNGASRPGTSGTSAGGDPLMSPASATFHDASQSLGGSPSVNNDAASSVAEQYCDFCDSGEHDILNCNAINGAAKKEESLSVPADHTVPPLRVKKSFQSLRAEDNSSPAEGRGAPLLPPPPPSSSAPVAPAATATAAGGRLEVRDYPEGTAAPGKSTGAIDMSKWCAMCEHEGHESIDCPFEDDY